MATLDQLRNNPKDPAIHGQKAYNDWLAAVDRAAGIADSQTTNLGAAYIPQTPQAEPARYHGAVDPKPTTTALPTASPTGQPAGAGAIPPALLSYLETIARGVGQAPQAAPQGASPGGGTVVGNAGRVAVAGVGSVAEVLESAGPAVLLAGGGIAVAVWLSRRKK